MNARRILVFSVCLVFCSPLLTLTAQKQSKKLKTEESKPAAAPEAQKAPEKMSAATFAGLGLRPIGPALISGRIVAIAVDPSDRAHYYVGAASGGVWETKNDGGTWAPLFDHEGSYSIGAIAIDPRNPSVVWVGTGEGNSQRSVAYGDGVYRSDDGGASWTNVGLKDSQHIGKIVIDPKDTNTVYVAAQGPLWSAGGDRGLYKTTDAGKSWTKILSISEHTGVADVEMDPTDPDVLYASAWQRERRAWTLIDGGPESAIYKSTDAGKTWNKMTKGLPSGDMGRIGLAIAPADHNVIYAEIEAADRKGGIFRSTDRGATWKQQSPFAAQGMYYGVLEPDPKNVDRLYVMNVVIMVSDDGGKTVHPIGLRNEHSDNHVMWIDPSDTDYMLVGCDGGVYETYDRGENWIWKANLPLAQFYDVAVDNADPFYFVYGGTQDNFSLGGPSRTTSASGITNEDWFVTTGGDGFHSQADPEDPNTIYAESQYGVLGRYDRATGQQKGIQPQQTAGGPPLRWWWDSPILISPHSHTRLYFGSQILFRSDDRGDNWQAISPDLSRQMDRNQLPVMGKIWGPDAVAKHESTSLYGEIVAIAESPIQEGLLYTGTDDGLIQISPDGGKTWKKHDTFSGVPDRAFVTRIVASSHDVKTVYAAFDNHKNGDFHPYLLRSADGGETWNSIAANLPENGAVLAFAEDPVDANLLFAGTEFGAYFSADSGKKWVQLTGNFPVISVHDLTIQKRENDLVVATFGRGFYVLDDITPLRNSKPEEFEQNAMLFSVKKAPMYIESMRLGLPGKGFQGAAFFTDPNPPFGATITYYLKDKLLTKKEQREKAEKDAEKAGKVLPYPTAEEFRAEAEEQPPALFFTVSDSSGKAIRQIPALNAPGIHRATWDLSYPATTVPLRPLSPEEEVFFGGRDRGPLVMPGTYSVTLSQQVDGVIKQIAGPQTFEVYPLGAGAMKPEDHAALASFQLQVAHLYGAVTGAMETANDLNTRLGIITRALQQTPGAYTNLIAQADSIRQKNTAILRALRGDEVMSARGEAVPESISERVGTIMENERMSSSSPSGTDRQSYDVASQEFTQVLSQLHSLMEVDVANLQKAMQAAGAPWAPGTIPSWPQQN
ncbi:MAG TPA: hypothetical protein VGT03_11035 [Candidatus Acidoferrales bacterium]|nr:hypothetical protein [Candidatus Acidoferrales bacterium]